MTEDTQEPLAPARADVLAPEENIAAADAAYQPIPSFIDWASACRVDDALWSQYTANLDAGRSAAGNDAMARAASVATRSAALETGAIEGLYPTERGFTFTIATEAAAWQSVIEERGAGVRAHFEDQLAAYELVLDAATRSLPVTQAFTRGLHEIATRSQETYVAHTPSGTQDQPLPRGEYKHQPNHVLQPGGSIHSYAPVLQTEPEMVRLVDELGTEHFGQAHPILQAAYAHYCLAAIHPFVDGNGRVARALASIYLYRAVSMPLVIFSDQKLLYLDALALADAGHHQAFVDFVFERALDTINLLTDQLRIAAATPLPERLESFRALLRSSGGLLHQELDAAAARLLSLAETAIRTRAQEIDLPKGVTVQVVGTADQNVSVLDGYRRVIQGGHQVGRILFRSAEPAGAQIEHRCDVTIATEKTARDTLRLRIFGRPDDLLVPVGEIHPAETEVLRIRLRLWAEAFLTESLGALYELAAESLKAKGY